MPPSDEEDNMGNEETVPDWVEEEDTEADKEARKEFEKIHPSVKAYLQAVRDRIGKDTPASPWILPPDAFTTLIKGSKLSFDCFLLPRVFVWDPETYLPGTRPSCIKPGCGMTMKGNGWSHWFRPVIDVNDR